MIVNIRRVSDTAITPVKSHTQDACFDLFANEDVVLKYGETKVVPTGIAIELPDGYYADVRPRSGLTSKSALRVHLGTIDSNYRGDIGIICENASHEENELVVASGVAWTISATVNGKEHEMTSRLEKEWDKLTENSEITIKRGDKIAQILVQKLPEIELVEVNQLSDSERGINGFGSTGTK